MGSNDIVSGVEGVGADYCREGGWWAGGGADDQKVNTGFSFCKLPSQQTKIRGHERQSTKRQNFKYLRISKMPTKRQPKGQD